MPKVTIWIRKEDEAKWQAIKDKPEWLHEHLSVIPNTYVKVDRILQDHLDGDVLRSIDATKGTATETLKPARNFLDKKKGTR